MHLVGGRAQHRVTELADGTDRHARQSLRPCPAPDQHHLVAVHDLAAVLRSEVAGLAAEQRRHLAGVVGDQPAGDDHAVGPDQLDRVVGEEVAGEPGDAGGQQGGVPLEHRTHRALVEQQPAARAAGVPQPELAGTGPATGRGEERADPLPRQRGGGLGGGRDDDGDAGLRRDQRRLDLGRHAAGADAVALGGAEGDGGEVGRTGDGVDELGGTHARIAVVDAVHVGEQDERVGLGDVRDEGGEAVVVAEPDLLGRHRVVLVDDRQRPEREQPLHRLVGVAVVAAPGQVVGGQQHLADGDAVPGEGVGVGLHQPELPDAGRGLRRRQVTRPAAQPQRGQPGGDRAGGDEHDLAARRRARRRGRRRAPTAGRRPGLRAAWSATTSRP